MRGAFITLEGGEGAGKSTLARRLEFAIRAMGLRVDLTREPGGTPDAEALRHLLVTGGANRWSPMEEACLLFAARLNHVRNRIAPALDRGDWVICDRFTDSSIAYQGYAGNGPQDLSRIYRLAELLLGDFKPNLTLVVDINPRIGLQRTIQRGEAATRFELFSMDFHDRLRQGFLNIAAQEPVRCVVIDGSLHPDDVFRQAVEAIESRLRWPKARHLLEFQPA